MFLDPTIHACIRPRRSRFSQGNEQDSSQHEGNASEQTQQQERADGEQQQNERSSQQVGQLADALKAKLKLAPILARRLDDNTQSSGSFSSQRVGRPQAEGWHRPSATIMSVFASGLMVQGAGAGWGWAPGHCSCPSCCLRPMQSSSTEKGPSPRMSPGRSNASSHQHEYTKVRSLGCRGARRGPMYSSLPDLTLSPFTSRTLFAAPLAAALAGGPESGLLAPRGLQQPATGEPKAHNHDAGRLACILPQPTHQPVVLLLCTFVQIAQIAATGRDASSPTASKTPPTSTHSFDAAKKQVGAAAARAAASWIGTLA